MRWKTCECTRRVNGLVKRVSNKSETGSMAERADEVFSPQYLTFYVVREFSDFWTLQVNSFDFGNEQWDR